MADKNEYSVVETPNGPALRVMKPDYLIWDRDSIEARIAGLEAALVEAKELLSKMDELGIE